MANQRHECSAAFQGRVVLSKLITILIGFDAEVASPARTSRNSFAAVFSKTGPNRGETAPKPPICIGVGTEASRRPVFLGSVGPTERELRVTERSCSRAIDTPLANAD